MVNFQYYNPSKIVFGSGAASNLPRLLQEQNVHSLLMIYSGEYIHNLGIFNLVEDTCQEAGIRFTENGHVLPNPDIGLVRELIETARAHEVDFILAVGGGGPIDTAKAVAMGIPYDGDVWDFFARGTVPEQVLPVGVISTISSSGSETSNCAILSSGTWKLGYEDDRIIPCFAIMDPVYTASLPWHQTASGIADILSHLLERYFSAVEHTDVTDFMIEGAVKALLLNAERLKTDPSDQDARAEIQWLASVAHNNFLDAGRIADWGSHRIEHELSARYGIIHGEGMAVVLPAWLRYAAVHKPKKPAQLAYRVWGVDPSLTGEQEAVLLLAEKLKEWFRSLSLRVSLTELEIGSEHFREMAEQATLNGPVGHYIPLDSDAVEAILELAV